MNTPEEFNIFVEKVVRPIRVPTKRKRRMREELLSHMSGLHEELRQTNQLSEEQSVAETISRMGQPAELTEEFRGEESLWNSLYLALETSRYDPREKHKFLLKHFLLSVLIAIFIAVLCLFVVIIPQKPGLGIKFCIQFALVVASFSFVLETLFLLLVDRISRSIHNLQLKPSRLATALYFLLSLMLVPIVASVVYFGFSLGNELIMFNTTFVLCVAPVIPILLILVSKQAAEEIVYYEQWADLEIE